MNIFVLDTDPQKAAEFHCDKHVVKMIVETAQLLSTAYHVNDPVAASKLFLYKKTHTNHPCAIWVRQSKENFNWLLNLGFFLCQEYTRRYKKFHKTNAVFNILKSNPLTIFPQKGFTSQPACMPDYCKKSDVVDSYRNYYCNEKKSFAVWKNKQPEWFTNMRNTK